MGSVPILLPQRLIAFFDILGFSDRLGSMPLTDLHALYVQLIDDVRMTVFSSEVIGTPQKPSKSNFDRANFLFDSIILVSRDLSDEHAGGAIHDFLMSCSLLMEKSFAKQLPLRGAIGFGDYLEDTERNIFLSPEFANLARIEKDQEWSGCVVLPDAMEKILPVIFLQPDLATPHYEHRAMVLSLFDVPFKSSEHVQPGKHWCINWVYFLDPFDRATGLEFLKSPKRENTIRFVEYIEKLPDEDRRLPNQFRPAVRVLGQGTRAGVRIKFINESGKGVDPPASCRVNISLNLGAYSIVLPVPLVDKTGAADSQTRELEKGEARDP
jgi:hypothetical protein